MPAIGLNENLVVQGHTFHLQTSSIPEKSKIRTTLFDMKKSKVVYVAEVPYEASLGDAELRQLVQSVHSRKMSESSRLFQLASHLDAAVGAEAKSRLGQAYVHGRMTDEAAQAFRAAIEEAPEWSEPYLHLAVLHLTRGRNDEAVDLLTQAEQLSPNYADVHYHRGVVEAKRGAFDLARTHLDRAISLNASYVAARLHRLMLDLRQANEANHGLASARADACQRLLPAVAEAVPQGSPYMNPHFTKGCFLLQEGRADEAMVAILQAVSLGDTILASRSSESALSLLKIDTGAPEQMPEEELERQIRTLEAQLEEHPTYADLRHALALCRMYAAAAQVERAERELETAIGINPDFTKARANLQRIRDHAEEFRGFLRTLLK